MGLPVLLITRDVLFDTDFLLASVPVLRKPFRLKQLEDPISSLRSGNLRYSCQRRSVQFFRKFNLIKNNSVSTIRQELNSYLGPAEIIRAHKPVLWLDYSVVALAVLAFIANFFLLHALVSESVLVAIFVSIFQGWLVTIFGLLAHDLFVHRRSRLNFIDRLLGILLFLPLLFPFTLYQAGHLRHHRSLGTKDDTERYKQGLNTRFRRLVFTTIIGFQLASLGKFSNGEHRGYRDLKKLSSEQLNKIKYENIVVFGFLIFVIVMSFVADWRVMLLGFWFPVLVVATFLNSIRILIEHAEVDEANSYWIATAYKTGIFSRILFLADAGDCHLLHHVYARVPWYRMPRLVQLAMPFFIERGVETRDSIWKMFDGWFIRNYPHRSRWFTS
jgi:fatty acid desaturase